MRREPRPLPRPSWGWQENAACRDEPLSLFFGPFGEKQAEREAREQEAAKVCASCPVKRECLDYAVDRPERYGYWGSMSEDQRDVERRKRLRRKARAA